MKVTVVGTGYVGLVTGACLADLGNTVMCLDVDESKIELLKNGVCPIYEPGLPEILIRNLREKRLQFTLDAQSAVEHAEVIFIAVGTPAKMDGHPDMSFVHQAARKIGKYADGFKVIVNKSTVPVGTAEAVSSIVNQELASRQDALSHHTVLSNPEFLKEGAAVADFTRPDRIVIGHDTDAAGEEGLEILKKLYSPFMRNRERVVAMDVRSAEFTKYAANAMLATRISFMNEMANIADGLEVDIESVRQGIGSDPRIGYSFLYAGIGYGGSCFPKDVDALRNHASNVGQPSRLLDAVADVNHDQKRLLVKKIVAHFGPDLSGRKFALWGLAFKPNTDDMREAPSRVIVRELLIRGATVAAYDPVAAATAKSAIYDDLAERVDLLANVEFVEDPYDALVRSDALVLATEWRSFVSPDFDRIRSALNDPVIFDGRNVYDPALRQAGFKYFAVGR